MPNALKDNIIANIIISMRPKQWTKGVFIFGAILFSQNIFNWAMLSKVILITIVFSALSSSVYLINDVFDIEKDKKHPRKKSRPIAAGKVPIWLASSIAVILAIVSIIVSFRFNYYTGVVSLVYFLQSIFYTMYFKNIVIMDVILLAAGYVLRAIVGGTVIGVEVSVWLLICITLLALFLGLCRRRNEICLLNEKASSHRKILEDYSKELIDQMINVVTSSTLVVYSLYTFLSMQNRYLMITIPFVLYGIFRYLYLVYKQDGGGEPEEIVLKDKPMILNILLWVLTIGLVLYI